uniref:Uncharacterized protein n=1 Tax=Arundo donax TaxID=35708 RepID=A0A0A9FQZ0_ARUDO
MHLILCLCLLFFAIHGLFADNSFLKTISNT